ncbi:YqiA/YcfP family alpha/beta fold hydrolase [Massilia sp. CF038]|uniref:YqiA/YcfP family alpha/beta fold hydrolase n=1 Tax=Massilia sp. CF038 TaxID=1881045 RepID=UPI00091C9EB0|nr:YqiA/YcfP family alpha/beta fold hydrolase [Massilia sp. CF038]SHG36293.1 hypothetical protein SAMN05428948_0087 [Massilia sp. CF038]
MIVYLHGFRSSPRSFKARVVAASMKQRGMAAELLCPQLPASPKEAMALVQTLLAPYKAHQVAIIGSSLGGYYATWLAEQMGCRAVLLNPAIVPLQDLDQHVGVTTEYHSDKPFEFKREYIDELRALAVDQITRPERYYLIAATGDEVLDYRAMVRHYAGAEQRVIDGSDHAISEFPQYVDEVLAFCLAADAQQ